MPSIEKPRCIVLPFQDSKRPGAGLALQFLLSNVIAAHRAFKECWFGWRTARIFPKPEALKHYCAAGGGELDLPGLSADQKVPCWVSGRADERLVEMNFFNMRAQAAGLSEACAFSTADDLVGFRRCFIEMLGRAGFPVPRKRLPLMLWPERISVQGLYMVGKALELFYLHSSFGQPDTLDLDLFEAAVALAPDSFMAHDLLGWAWYRKNESERAKASFLRALVLSPDAIGPMAGLAGCAVMQKDQEEALYWAARKAFTQGVNVDAAVEKTRRKFDP